MASTVGGPGDVREAFAAVRRADFLPPAERRFADQDRALPIGWDQTNSQPTTVAEMLALLDVHRGHRVLDVGSGSGWSTALLGHLVGRTGQVHGVELVPELAAIGRDNVGGYAMPWVQIHQAEVDILGLPGAAPFDRILVSAGAETLPDPLVDQLAPDGVLVVPVGGRMLRVTRTAERVLVERSGHYSFVPLIEPARQPHSPRTGPAS